MPLARRWSTYSGLDIPNQSGVYELAWSNTVVYIGKGDVANRIVHRDRKIWSFNRIRYQITNGSRRAEQRERAELRDHRDKNGHLPKYNSQFG